ncbi:MAG: hypothetical protein R2812_11675 [Gelidibacter sp.]
MKNLALVLALTFSTLVISQNFEVPKNYTFKVEKDYAKYEKDIIKCINWLENTPINQDTEKRKEANAFLMQWLTGAPNVSINLAPYVVDLTEKNPDLMMLFLGGWTKYALQNPKDKSTFNGNLAGVKNLMTFYSNNEKTEIKKDKNIEKLLKLTETDLKKWLETKLIN